jgi:hypothetical protein
MENKVVFYENEKVKVYKTDERDVYLVVGADFECKLTGDEIIKLLWK